MQSLIYNLVPKIKFLAVGVVLLVLALPANAQFNQQVNYQGKLVSNTGVAVTSGNYPVVFKLYTVATSGTAVWTENRFGASQVAVTSGLFSVMLGSVTSLAGVDFNQTLYLGVTVASDTEMLPRKVLGAVPAAFESKNTQTLGGLASTSFVRTDRDSAIASTTTNTLLTITQNGTGNILDLLDGAVNVFTVRDGGNVGIGTTTPGSKLTIGGNVYVAGNITATGTLAIFGTSTLATTTISSSTISTLNLTNALGALSGGTGLSTITQNQLLIGGAGNTWSQVATSSLGLSSLFTTIAQLDAIVTDVTGVTGTGSFTLATSPTFTTQLTAPKILGGTTAAQTLTLQTTSGVGTTDSIRFLGGTNGGTQLGKLDNGSTYNVAFGSDAGLTFNALTVRNIAIGYQAGSNASSTTADYNIYTGAYAGYDNTGFYNSIVGALAGFNNSGSENGLFGWHTGQNNTGDRNTFFGTLTGYDNTGSYNSFIGAFAGQYNSGSDNTFFGSFSGSFNTGDHNQFIGTEAGVYLQATSTIALGAFALSGGEYSTGAPYQAVNNTVIGYRAGFNATNSANNNILLGYQAAQNLGSGANNIIIGYNVDLIATSTSNSLNIGNLIFGTGINGVGTTLSSGNVGIGTTTPGSKLTVIGSAYFAGAVSATGSLAISGLSTLATTTISSSTISTLNLTNALSALSGGTGFATYTAGDFIYASGLNTLAKRAIGATGDVLSVVSGVPTWVATSTLGFGAGAGASTFLALTDTPASFSANRIMFTNAGATALTDSANLTFNGSELTTLNLNVTGTSTFAGASTFANLVSENATTTALAVTSLIAGEVPYITAGGKLTTSGFLSFDGELLKVGSAGDIGTSKFQVVNVTNLNLAELASSTAYIYEEDSATVNGGNKTGNTFKVESNLGTLISGTGSFTNSGNVLYTNRSVWSLGAADTLTISGAVARFEDQNCNIGGGTCVSTANGLEIIQNNLINTGSALNITSASTNGGFIFRANDDGTLTDTSPFVVTQTGSVGIGTTTPTDKLAIVGGGVVANTPNNPTLKSTYDTTGTARRVSVYGRYAYVADELSGLQIIDISNPASPTLVGTYDTPSVASQVVVAGRYAYVADAASGLQIIDISNPASTTLVGTYNTSGNAYGVTVSGRYAYVGDYTSGLHIIDISNPTAPTLVSTYNTSGLAREIAISGNYAYVADDTAGVQIIDISNPANPTLKGVYNTSGIAYSISINGRYAYIADEISGLQILNISNPATPTLVGSYNTTGLAYSISINGRYAYIADEISGLQIIDINNPASPTLVSTLDTTGLAQGIAINGRYAYIADETSGLQIIDINGSEFSSAFAGSFSSTVASIDTDLLVGNQATIQGMLNVGNNAAIGGSLTITGSASSSMLTTGTHAALIVLSGNVGIGTSTPNAALTVFGNINISSTTQGYSLAGNRVLSSIGTSTMVGVLAGSSVGTGYGLTAVGYLSLTANTVGEGNSALGSYAARFTTTGSSNTAIGGYALYSNITGGFNTALGYQAGYDINGAASTGYNTILGFNTGRGITTGTNNTILGANVTGLSATLANTVIIADGAGNQRIYIDNNGNTGIGSTSPVSRLSVQVNSFSASGTAGFNRNYIFTNAASGTAQYGELSYIRASSSATSTIVGSLFRVEDSTIFGNTVRGLEVQTNRGTNTQGENTALSGFARTFGVRGYTSGDAGATFEPAGGFFETGGTTQGNAIRGYSSTITTSKMFSLFQDTSTFTGTGLLMNFGNSGGSFTATTSKFVDLQNAGTSRFTISAFGTTTIGDGTTNKLAGLQIGFGGLCVDNDGSCTASTSGRISSVSTATGNSDLAEMYFSNENLLPGEIVYAKGNLSIGRASEDTKAKIIGVVSTKPGVTMGFDDKSLTPGETGSPIALTGRVPIRLSDENGAVKVGDELMLSSIPGVAMKATGTGAIIGVALEDFDSGRAYSDTYVNQFGDDIVEPVYKPVTTITDTRINDGCYYGGGNATGEEVCVPLKATTTDARVAEAAELAARAARQAALDALARQGSQRKMTAAGNSVHVGQIVMFVDLRYRFLDETNQAMLASLMLSSDNAMESIIGNENTVWGRLVTLAHNFVDGVLTIAGVKTDKVETRELCVDEVCMTADDLRELLEQKDGTAPPTPEVPPHNPEPDNTSGDLNLPTDSPSTGGDAGTGDEDGVGGSGTTTEALPAESLPPPAVDTPLVIETPATDTSDGEMNLQ